MIRIFPKKRETPFLVLDIGTKAIKSLICKKEDKNLVVLGNSIFNLEKYNDFNIKRATLNSIDQTYKNFIFFADKKDREIYSWRKLPILVSLTPSILKARIISQSLKRDRSSRISKLEQKAILHKILKKTRQDISQKFAKRSGILARDIKWTNFRVLESKINGYPVPEFKGRQGKNLDLKILAVFLGKDHFKEIQRIFRGLGLKISKIAHLAEALSDPETGTIYPKDLKNIKDATKSLETSQYVPSLLIAHYAKEIL